MGIHRVTAELWREGEWWVARAIEVNVASQGKSKEEAQSNLKEALELYFEPEGPGSLAMTREVWSKQNTSSL